VEEGVEEGVDKGVEEERVEGGHLPSATSSDGRPGRKSLPTSLQ